APTGGGHVRIDRLRGEELVPQVDREPVVPILGGDRVEGMALVVGRVVDQDPDRPEPPARLGDGVPERRDVPEIARQEEPALPPRGADRVPEALCRRLIDVEERHARSLGREVLDDGGADAAGAARDQDDAVAQARVRGVGHAILPDALRAMDSKSASTLAHARRLARAPRHPVSSRAWTY